jgi:hypothetical protein
MALRRLHFSGPDISPVFMKDGTFHGNKKNYGN